MDENEQIEEGFALEMVKDLDEQAPIFPTHFIAPDEGWAQRVGLFS